MGTGDWITLAAAVVAAIGVLSGAIGIPYYFGRRFARFDAQMSGLRNNVNGLNSLVAIILRILHRQKALDDAEFSEVIQAYANIIAGAGVDATIQREAALGNPLNREEAVRLRGYVAQARRGEFFTSDQVEDYNRLVKRMEQDRPDDPGVWPLVALGAFLLGLFLASKSEEQDPEALGTSGPSRLFLFGRAEVAER